MATPQDNVVGLTGNAEIDALTQGSAWAHGSGTTQLTYSLSLNDTSAGGAWTAALTNAVQAALAAWSNVANISFTESGSGGVFTSSPADIAITLTGDRLDQFGSSFFPGPETAALQQAEKFGYTSAQYPNPSGDVFFDNDRGEYSELAAGGKGLEFMLHEIGHALGLKHTNERDGAHPSLEDVGLGSLDAAAYSVMINTPTGPDWHQDHAATPMLLDIQAIQSIYGANMSFHAGNDTYVLSNSGTPHLEALWDAGGTDTFDGSLLTGGATLDLREGSFTSHGGTATGIAYGVQIENAVGGSGNDTIIGGNANNGLFTSGGNDTFEGGGGFDTLHLTGNRADYTISNSGAYHTFTTGGTTQSVHGVETVQFADGALSLHDMVMNYGDTNGDGMSDLLWRNTDGTVALWNMNGATVTGGAVVGPATMPAGWSAEGSGDFNGDGHADMLWRSSDGSVAIWNLSGDSLVGNDYAGQRFVPLSWSIAGTGDFNGDNKADILWHNDDGSVALWMMDNTSLVSGGTAGGAVPLSWSIAGTGDFNGDNKADILWRNTDGSVAVWLMDGTTVTGGAVVGPAVPNDWRIEGTADFDGNGKDDILWRNTDGSVAVWLMDGTSSVGGGYVGPANVPSEWTIAATGDFNGDGKGDIAWHNDNGQVAMWYLNGSSLIGGDIVGPTLPTDWHPV